MKWIHGLMMVGGVIGMSATAQAAAITSGTFTMYDPTGAVVGGSAVVTGDPTTGMTSPTPFFGFKWTAHNLSLVSGTTYNAPFDWGATSNIPVVLAWGVTGSNWVTQDSDSDGIPGTAMTGGPFTGFSPYFNVNVVPEPMSMALVGTALAGLIGLRRRFQA